MTVDTLWLIGFLSVFLRMSAMFLAAPLLGTMVPVPLRIMITTALSASLTHTAVPHLAGVPDNLGTLLLMAGGDIMTGLIIGSFCQLLLMSFQAAGGFADLQMGLASAQVFNPQLGISVTPLANLKFLLASVLFFAVDGHHLMIQSVVGSYGATGPLAHGAVPLMESLITFLGQTALLTLQIAAPIAGVTAIIDIAASLINRAVPQTQPFLLALPAKVSLGIVILGAALPAVASSLNIGLDVAFDHIDHILMGGS